MVTSLTNLPVEAMSQVATLSHFCSEVGRLFVVMKSLYYKFTTIAIEHIIKRIRTASMFDYVVTGIVALPSVPTGPLSSIHANSQGSSCTGFNVVVTLGSCVDHGTTSMLTASETEFSMETLTRCGHNYHKIPDNRTVALTRRLQLGGTSSVFVREQHADDIRIWSTTRDLRHINTRLVQVWTVLGCHHKESHPVTLKCPLKAFGVRVIPRIVRLRFSFGPIRCLLI
jgi:hypothetical protein